MSMTMPSREYWTQVSTIAKRLANGDEVIRLGYLAGASKALFLASLSHLLGRPLVVITPVSTEAEALVHDLRFFTSSTVSPPQIMLFPAEELHRTNQPRKPLISRHSALLPYDRCSSSPANYHRHTTSHAPLCSPPRATPTERPLPHSRDDHRATRLIEHLLRCDYHQVDMVGNGETSA